MITEEEINAHPIVRMLSEMLAKRSYPKGYGQKRVENKLATLKKRLRKQGGWLPKKNRELGTPRREWDAIT